MSEDKIKKLSDELTDLQEQLSGLKNSKLPKKTKKRIITTERIVFGLIIFGLIIFFVVSTGVLGKINPWKKFEFNWENSTTRNFENLEITPYCYHVGDKVDGEKIDVSLIEDEGLLGIGQVKGKVKDFSICFDKDIEKNDGEFTVASYIIEYIEEPEAYSSLEKIKSSLISNEEGFLSNLYLVEGEEQNIYVGEVPPEDTEFEYLYFWNKEKYLFYVMSSETFKTKKLVQSIVEEYTGEPEISLEKTREIFTLSCGDGICSEGINENCNSCTKDCGCDSGKECAKEDYGNYYSCKNSRGQYCDSSSDCATGYCVHNYCRSGGTYCGDNYCDETYYDENYNSLSGENCGNCPSDCDVNYNQQCINGEAKTSNTYYCSWDNDCASGNCVHETCRSMNTYCGDYYCDYPEDSGSCPSDC